MVNPVRLYKLRAVIFIIPLFLFLFSSSSAFAILGQEERLTQEINKQTEPKQEERQILKKPRLEYTAYGQRDPFEDSLTRENENKVKQESEVAVEPPRLNVQGVVWGGEIPQAILNNKVVKKGDIIEDAEVIDISKEGVNVLYKNRIFLLSSPASGYRSVGDKEVINEK